MVGLEAVSRSVLSRRVAFVFVPLTYSKIFSQKAKYSYLDELELKKFSHVSSYKQFARVDSFSGANLKI